MSPTPFFASPPLTARLTSTWTVSPTPPPAPRSADLFMIMFVSIFIFLTAAILRLIPWVSPLQPYTRWSAHTTIPRGAEADALRTYRSYAPYGALEGGEGGRGYETLLEIGEQIGSAKIGFSEEQIDILPSYQCGGGATSREPQEEGGAEGKCAICREGYEDTDVIRVLPCGDEYHSECIAPWLKQQATCPLCRCRFA